ncbi:Glucose transport transcription regulator RGT1 [Lachancea thermotolerans]
MSASRRESEPKDAETSPEAGGAASDRRRSKTSRACDQCREKKTRCDFSDERPICSACQRMGKTCTFERVPMKRGPTKGYTRNSEPPEGFDTSRRGSRKRSSSDVFKEDAGRPRPDPVSLPPLAQYLPQSGSQPRLQPLLAPGAQPQQQFWKVPYYEYQHQRRGSIDSLGSDVSNRNGSEQLAYLPSNASSGSQFYPASQAQYASQLPPDVEGANPEDCRGSLSLPAIQKFQQPPSGYYLQYPYSQFSMLPQQQQQQQQQNTQQSYFASQYVPPAAPPGAEHFKEFDEGFHSRKGSDVSVAVSPSSPVQVTRTQQAGLNSESRDTNTATAVSPKPLSEPSKPQMQTERSSSKSDGNHNGPRKQKRKNSNRNKPGSQSSIESIASSSHASIIYGKIPDKQLIDIYFEFIHPNFPVIPINKETLTDDLLLVNTQPISPVHELNTYILHWFRNSLELLVRVALKKPSGSGQAYSDGVVDILDSQATFINALNECFQRIVDIHPGLRENEKLLSLKTKFIYLATFSILNYILAFVGYDNSFVLGMSVTIYNECKLYRYLMYDELPSDDTEASENEDEAGAGDAHASGTPERGKSAKHDLGHQVLFKRLYVLLVVFDSLQSCAFGVPKLISVPLAELTEETFKFSTGKWCVERDPQRFETIRQSLVLGQVLSWLSISRKSVRRNSLQAAPQDASWKDEKSDSVSSSLFAKFLVQKHEMMEDFLLLAPLENSSHLLTFDLLSKSSTAICGLISSMHRLLALLMKINPTNSVDPNNRPPLRQGDFVHADTEIQSESSNPPAAAAAPDSCDAEKFDVYRKLLGLNGGQERHVAQGTISPFVISIVVEIRNVLELVKHLPTSIIGVVVNLLPNGEGENYQKRSHRLVMSLSNAMNELVQITSLISLLKPFKMFDHTLRSNRPSAKVSTKLLRQKFAPESVKTPSSQPPSSSPGPNSDGSNNTSLSQNTVMHAILDAAWDLMDGEELGWL